MSYITALLSTKHNKEDFTCGKEMLDKYLHTQAKQDVKRKLTACFILSDNEATVKGYYTLSNTSINRDFLPLGIIKKLPPSYQHLPATLLGRLAVDINYKGQGLGTHLLMDALKRSYHNSLQIASMAVIVDPLDDEAIAFYNHFGFIELPDSGKMFIPMAQLESVFTD
jgi:ribosomal protein S18 acetylase RimI-like enzyme